MVLASDRDASVPLGMDVAQTQQHEQMEARPSAGFHSTCRKTHLDVRNRGARHVDSRRCQTCCFFAASTFNQVLRARQPYAPFLCSP